ncbi:hypothetical protein JQ590_09540 [Bradyrhizobium diazoefficiens]|nr:hypothetical protein [Bradyrhizobium diazoefficiens]MBR0768477.1 hypothetical protein [Bradyrhizobium diazoefficiens]
MTKQDQAFLAFGKAMAAWARIEMGFYGWFEHVTGLDLRQAKPIYYSATSFKSRLDLIRAAMDGVIVDETEVIFLQEAFKLAQRCNSFRNKLAHGEFTIDGLVIQGKHVDRTIARAEAISLDHLAAYTVAFNEFSGLLFQARDVAENFFDDEPDDLVTLEDLAQRLVNLRREMAENNT